jgi:acyl carrier protein
MDKQAFALLLRETLQCESALEPGTVLRNLPEWDSLAAMAALALAERHFGKRLKLAQFKKLVTVEDMYVLFSSK